MDRRIIFTLVVMLIVIVGELYTYYTLRSLFSEQRSKRIFTLVYLAQTAFLIFAWYKSVDIIRNGSIERSFMDNFYIGIAFTAFISKTVFIILMLLQDGGRLLFGLGTWMTNLIKGDQAAITLMPGRREFLTKGAVLFAGIPFFGMLYGITKGKYQYTVNKLSLAFQNLPKAFNGLRIVQISDIHSGSFDSAESVAKGIAMINDLKPDLILFTGDLVNFEKDEINPYIDVFANLEAPLGKYAILGNHDYYGTERQEPGKRQQYWDDFMSKYPALGFKLLKNENVTIEKEGEKIAILGVENWGAGNYFQKYGDLDKAAQGINEDTFAILMSHDPTHWTEKIIPHQRTFPLTLSGHTHGMQFGIDIPGFKWSPVKYRYKHWSGLYQEAGQYLYVNKGFGFLGFPGRIGMWPEITLLEMNTVS